MTQASVSEFENQRNKMPGDRKQITAVGPFILELYTDPLGQRPRTVIEINKKRSDGSYSKEDSLWFEDESEATDTYHEIKSSESKIKQKL